MVCRRRLEIRPGARTGATAMARESAVKAAGEGGSAASNVGSRDDMLHGEATVTRRTVIRAIGGGLATVVVLGAGGVAIRADRQGVFSAGEGPAYAAWADWDGASGDSPAMAMVRAAILGANGHNIQPWRFMLGTDRITIAVDPLRTAGALDPLLRERDISIGAAVENLVVAASAHGYAATPSVSVDGAAPRVDITLATGGGDPSDSLFDAIPNRHTDRGAFDTGRTLTTDELEALSALNDEDDLAVVWLADDAGKAAFSDLTVAATAAIIADTEQSTDSFAWWRGDGPAIDRHKDGITIDTSGIPAWKQAAAKILPAQSRSQFDASWLSSTRDTHLPTAAAFGIVVARDLDAIPQRVAVGRLYQRLHLSAVTAGMAMQPLNQVVERRDRERQLGLEPAVGGPLAALVGGDTWAAMMPFRIGYPRGSVARSPRRPADQVVVA